MQIITINRLTAALSSFHPLHFRCFFCSVLFPLFNFTISTPHMLMMMLMSLMMMLLMVSLMMLMSSMTMLMVMSPMVILSLMSRISLMMSPMTMIVITDDDVTGDDADGDVTVVDDDIADDDVITDVADDDVVDFADDVIDDFTHVNDDIITDDDVTGDVISDEPQDLCPLYRPGEWEELPSERDLNPFSRYESLGSSSQPIVLDEIETSIADTSDVHIADKSPSDEGFTELELLQSDSNTSCSGLQGATLQEHTKTPEDEDEGLHNRSTDDGAVEVTKRRSQMFANGPNVEESKGSKAELSEAEKRRRASEAEMKSWLLKRMQRPIEGKSA